MAETTRKTRTAKRAGTTRKPTLEARDRAVALVTELRDATPTRSGAGRRISNLERRGSSARTQLEREVRRARTRIERTAGSAKERVTAIA